MNVIKRDGTKVAFDMGKIKSAITQTNKRTNEMTEADIDRIVGVVANKCERETGDLSVEKIQDLVEDTLLKSRFNATAKSYILYRDQRTRIRQGKSKMMQEILELVLCFYIVLGDNFENLVLSGITHECLLKYS